MRKAVMCCTLMKQTNKTVKPVAESVEGRTQTERNSREHAGGRTQSRATPTSRLAAVREAARVDPALVFTNLMTHLTPVLLYEAFMALDRRAASGSDGVSWR
jgi:hypothetical protein